MFGRTRAYWGLLGVLAVALAGCQEGGVGDTVEATGKVTYNGAPVSGANVMFSGPGLSATAFTDANGDFQLTTRGQPGAIPGTYKVTITRITAAPTGGAEYVDPLKGLPKPVDPSAAPTPTETPKSEIPAKYTDAGTTPLERTVTDDPAKNKFDIVLTD
jgi:hypothetical protein